MTADTARLADVVRMRTGKLDSNAAVEGGEFPFFTCSQQTLQIDEPAYETEAVLLGGNNAAGVFPLKYYKGQFNAYQRTYIIETLDTGVLNILYLYYALRPALSHFQSASIGAATQYLTKGILDNFQVSVPPIEVQRSIANILCAYDNLIETNRRRIQLLEQAARLLYKEWFVHLRFPGHEHVKIVDGVPEGWERRTLGKICVLRAGNTFKPKYQGKPEGDLPFIKVRDLNRHGNTLAITGADNWVGFDECVELRGKPFAQGTSVFAKIGEGLRQNRLRILVRDTLIDNNMMGAIPNPNLTVGEYLYFLLQGHDLASYAGGAAVPFLSSKVLERVEVLAPPMKLLLLFQDAVAPTFQQIVNLEQQSASATRARDLLLPRLMSGEVAV